VASTKLRAVLKETSGRFINYAEKLLYNRPVSNGAEEIGPQPNGKSEKVQEKWRGRGKWGVPTIGKSC